jgi:hypothetical protein
MNTQNPLLPRGASRPPGRSATCSNSLWIAAIRAGRIPRLFGALCALAFCFNPAQAAPAGTNESGVQLTIELRDGSRVVGKSLEDILSFHSAALGDMKLAWAGIRSIEYAGANTDFARLTAANGDGFAVQLSTDVLRVETGFGQTELPVKLIRSIKVSAAGRVGQLPPGMVSLWSGEGNANDNVGANNGTLMGGVTFANGKVGRAFNFDGRSGFVSVPHNALWDFGNNPFTIAFWANFSSPGRIEALISDDNGVGSEVNKWVLFHGMQGNALTFHTRGTASADINVPFSPVAGQWYHIALTRNGLVWTFYANGSVIGTARVSVTVPSMTAPLTIGNAEQLYFFNGRMDEVSIYNRALSSEEIRAICTEQNNGEPLPGLARVGAEVQVVPPGVIAFPPGVRAVPPNVVAVPPNMMAVQHGVPGAPIIRRPGMAGDPPAADSVEGQMRSEGMTWEQTQDPIQAGMYVEDVLAGRLNQPPGRGTIGKVTATDVFIGLDHAWVDFGRGCVEHIRDSEIRPIRFLHAAGMNDANAIY